MGVKYTIIVQACPEEILAVKSPEDLNLARLQNWPSIENICVTIPNTQDAREAVDLLDKWGFNAYIGDDYNVCKRIISAMKQYPGQPFAVRTLATHRHIDLEYVDRLVQYMQMNPNLDLVTSPKDFDLTLAADVGNLKALERIGNLTGDTQELNRARFTPWGYMEAHPEQFSIHFLEPAPSYDEKKVNAILAEARLHTEHEYLGRDYQGSRYHFLLDKIPPNMRILDISCGSGFGAHLLSQNANFVLGIDYLESYINAAKQRFNETEKLKFSTGDAMSFMPNNEAETFDIVISIHTLEHVPDDHAMMKNIYNNLKPNGLAIIDVPIIMRRPLGRPINPYHIREYTKEQIISLVNDAGFSIEKIYGCCRAIYGKEEITRDSIQIHAIKH